eukprot:jgi/Chrzof1/718/Cz01g26060.t1
MPAVSTFTVTLPPCREYHLPIPATSLAVGNHSLVIIIHPAAAAAAQAMQAYPHYVPASTHLGAIRYKNFIRKPAADFGWDFAPAFAPAGVAGRVVLHMFSRSSTSNGSNDSIQENSRKNSTAAGDAILLAVHIRQQHGRKIIRLLIQGRLLYAAAVKDPGTTGQQPRHLAPGRLHVSIPQLGVNVSQAYSNASTPAVACQQSSAGHVCDVVAQVHEGCEAALSDNVVAT